MYIHPQFDPVAIHLGPFSVHWYGLMYLLGFALFILLGRYRIRTQTTVMTNQMLDDLVFYGVLGVVIGGRLGYVLFYKPTLFFAHPLSILRIWEGGMSFHGGFLGVLIAIAIFAHRHKQNFWDLTDFIAPLVPLGLATGRLGNFINGELWGRVTSPHAPWAVLFPQAWSDDKLYAAKVPETLPLLLTYGGLPRHPSQLYQFALEGILLFLILWCFTHKPRRRAAASALFLIGYGLLRFISEFTREPDNFLGLLAFGLSMGQWLSLPMFIAGLLLMVWAHKKYPSK